MKCKNCGKEIGPNTIVCEHCGTVIDNSNSTNASQKSNINTGMTDNSALIGLIFIIAGIAMAIFTIIYLVEINNSTITHRYNSTTSSMVITFFMHILIQCVLSVILGLRIAANGLAVHKVQAIGNAIVLIGGVLFLMSSVGLGITLQLIGLIVFVIGCYKK